MKKLLWIDFEKGWLCLEEKKGDEHLYYEYIQFESNSKERVYPKLNCHKDMSQRF